MNDLIVERHLHADAADSRGERNAWFVPQTTTASTFTVRIYNDVNGVASIVADSEFSIGEPIGELRAPDRETAARRAMALFGVGSIRSSSDVSMAPLPSIRSAIGAMW
jgi:hypothetical protein